jgi:hypothetical protein
MTNHHSLMANRIDIDQITPDMHRDHCLIKVAYPGNSFLHHQYPWNMTQPSRKIKMDGDKYMYTYIKKYFIQKTKRKRFIKHD